MRYIVNTNQNRDRDRGRGRRRVLYFVAPQRDPSPLVFSVQPTNQSVSTGQTATFTIDTTGGTDPVTYQWQKLQPKAT